MGREMRWWGWGEDAHAGAISDAGARLAGGRARHARRAAAGRWRSMRCAWRSRGCPARVRERFGDDPARRPRRARAARRAASPIPTSCASARATRSGAPDAVLTPRDHDEVPRRAGGLRGRGRRRRALRRRHERRRRRRAAARGLRRARVARPRRRSTRSRRSTSARSWPSWAAGMRAVELEARAGRARLHPRPLPAELRVRDDRRLRGHALGRPGVDGLRAHRRARGRGAAGGAGRRPRPAPRSRRAPRAPSCAGSSSARRACWARSPGWRCGCARRPSSRRYEGWMFASFGAGAEALRRLEQGGAAPDVARLSDEDETRLGLGDGRPARRARGRAAGLSARARRGAAARWRSSGWAGPEEGVRVRREAAIEALRDAGGVALGQPAGRAWVRSRFHGPYLRDDLMDRGVMVETLETATTWAQLFTLYRAVGDVAARARAARRLPHLAPLSDGRVAVLHLHGAGAPRRGARAVGARSRRRRARRSSRPAGRSPITTRSGATTCPTSGARSAPPAWPRCARSRRELDPAGIMNPGKLLPSS